MPRKPTPVTVEPPQVIINQSPLAVTLQEAAKLIGISSKTMYTLSRRPEFPKISLGSGMTRSKSIVPVAALQRWLEANIGQYLNIEKEE